MADASLKIIIEAVTKNAQSEIKGLNSKAADLVKQFTGLSLSTASVTAGVMAAANAAKKAVVEYNQYVLSIDKAAASTGLAVDEYSRLVQAADDVRVSQEALTTALTMATKNGFEPSVENLAILADELQGMGTQSERAARLSEIFGRGWKEIYPLLENGGDALRDNAAAIADGLVVTEESVAQQKELWAAWDNLGDEGTELSNTLAQSLAPALIEVVNGLNDAVKGTKDLLSWQARLRTILRQHGADVLSTATTYDQYEAEMRRSALAAGLLVKEHDGLLQVYRLVNGQNQQLVTDFRILSQAEFENRDAVYSDVGALNALANAGPGAAGAIGEVGGAASTNTPAMAGLAGAADDYYQAVENAKKAGQEFGEQVGGDIKSAFEAAGIKGEELNTLLGIMDESLGTNYLPTQQLKDMTNELVASYLNGGRDAEAFKTKLDEMKAPMENLFQPIVNARVALQDMRAELEKITAQEWNIIINTVQGGGSVSQTGSDYIPSGASNVGGGNASSSNNWGGITGGGYGPGGASGLDFIVPSGYPNDSYPIRVQSGEHVKVTPASEVGKSTGGGQVVNIANLSLPGVTNYREFLRELGKSAAYKAAAGAARGGAY